MISSISTDRDFFRYRPAPFSLGFIVIRGAFQNFLGRIFFERGGEGKNVLILLFTPEKKLIQVYSNIYF